MTEKKEDERVVAMDQRAAADQTSASQPADPEGQAAGDEIQALRSELANTQQRAAESEDKYLRTRADMENYKKRVERSYAELSKSSKKQLLAKLLGVKDNLERALHYGESADTAGEGIMEGVRLTQYQLDQLLQQEGVKSIDSNGKPFDPSIEEAIQSVNDATVPDNTVVQVVRKGYTYEDEVLRPAQVIVSVHSEDSSG